MSTPRRPAPLPSSSPTSSPKEAAALDAMAQAPARRALSPTCSTEATRSTSPASKSFPSPQERRERNREQVVAAILEAARAVMRERGVAGLSLREVARRVGMQAPSLYEYFPSKAALYDALFLLAIRRFGARMDDLTPAEDSFWGRLRLHFEAYMAFALKNPELYQLTFERPVPGFVPSEASMAESSAELAAYYRQFEAAIDRGEIDPGISARQAGDLANAMMHGLASQHLANEPEVPLGSGRYGSLLPAALALFRASWEPREPAATGPGGSPGQPDRPHRQEGGSQTTQDT